MVSMTANDQKLRHGTQSAPPRISMISNTAAHVIKHEGQRRPGYFRAIDRSLLVSIPKTVNTLFVPSMVMHYQALVFFGSGSCRSALADTVNPSGSPRAVRSLRRHIDYVLPMPKSATESSRPDGLLSPSYAGGRQSLPCRRGSVSPCPAARSDTLGLGPNLVDSVTIAVAHADLILAVGIPLAARSRCHFNTRTATSSFGSTWEAALAFAKGGVESIRSRGHHAHHISHRRNKHEISMRPPDTNIRAFG